MAPDLMGCENNLRESHGLNNGQRKDISSRRRNESGENVSESEDNGGEMCFQSCKIQLL